MSDYVPDEHNMFAEALVNPIKYQSEMEKREQQLAVFQDSEDEDEERPRTASRENSSNSGSETKNIGNSLPAPIQFSNSSLNDNNYYS